MLENRKYDEVTLEEETVTMRIQVQREREDLDSTKTVLAVSVRVMDGSDVIWGNRRRSEER